MKLAHYVFVIVLLAAVFAPMLLMKGLSFVLVALLVVAGPLLIASWFVPRARKQ